MRAASGQEGARALALETRARQPRRRAEGARAEARQHQRMARRAQRAEDLAHELVGIADERIEQPAVGLRVRAESAGRLLHGALQHHRGAVVERVGQRRVGVRQLEPVLGQRQAAQEGRSERQGVHRRARVVHEAGQRQLLRAAAAAHGLGALDEGDPAAGPGQHDRRGQPVGARADYDGVVRVLRQPRDRA